MSGLTFIGSFQNRASVAGISVTDSLTTFVALRKWGTEDFHVMDVKFFTAEDGSGLVMCPYKKEFQKHMTLYDGTFNFNLALRDFCLTHGIARLGYSAEDVTLNAGNMKLVAVGVNQLGPALAVLRQTSPIKDRKDSTNILAHFINAIPKDGDLTKSFDRVEPVLALLYAIITTGEVEARAQRVRDIHFMQQSRKETFDIIMRGGMRLNVHKDGALANIRDGSATLASEEYGA
jgi:hypothetical protein